MKPICPACGVLAPVPNHAGLFRLCGAHDDDADDDDGIPCCSMPMGHGEPHDLTDGALERWMAAHGYSP